MQKPIRLSSCGNPTECRIVNHGSLTTLLAWKPLYDGDGNQLNDDPNMVETMFECRTCKKKWRRITQGKEETVIVNSD
jgi:hypothetical protein